MREKRDGTLASSRIGSSSKQKNDRAQVGAAQYVRLKRHGAVTDDEYLQDLDGQVLSAESIVPVSDIESEILRRAHFNSPKYRRWCVAGRPY